MAYQGNGGSKSGYVGKQQASSKPSYNNNKSQGDAKKSEAILSKLLRPSKAGTSTTFSVGDQDLVIPAHTRVVIVPLSEKRMVALAASAEKNGFKGATPTFEMVVFPITDK